MPASAALQNRLQEVVFQNPIVPYVMNGGAKVAGDVREIISPYDLVSKREFQRTDLYNDVLREIGMTEHLVTLVPAGLVDLGPNPHRLDVLASSLFPAVHRRGHFRQDERELLKLLRPHLMKAYQAAHFQLRLRGNGVTVTDPRALMVYGLTQREVEVLHWMREGKTDKEIAVILGISFRTVNLHVAAILRKLGVETRLGAVLKTFGKA
ncbi:hypothetical protein DB346_02535 [Verrucomicrobia bacterium LW23]|nr:hypothetical protein DB346_04120 [Verrucomicrobia bacterium LW23]PTY04522.1 hypothetical protein DB346_02535 [Verrucomicrobia bacterium LW23]